MVKELILYETRLGRKPFQAWLVGLKDFKAQALIKVRLDRLVLGHYGDCKHLRSGLYEMRLSYGPGYRVYFVELKNKSMVLLLAGGAKRAQGRDIKRALKYLKSFKERYDYE